MMDEASQREVASAVVEALAKRGIDAVLVGSTAVVALELYPKTTKDVDVVPVIQGGIDAVRQLAGEIAGELGAEVGEVGWGVVALVHRGDDGAVRWRVDLLAPDAGPFTARVVDRLAAHAVKTEVGPAACPEHVIAMKAVAWADSYGRGHARGMQRYEGDLEDIRDAVEDPDSGLIADLLSVFQDARAGPAARIVNQLFGTDLKEPAGPDVG